MHLNAISEVFAFAFKSICQNCNAFAFEFKLIGVTFKFQMLFKYFFKCNGLLYVHLLTIVGLQHSVLVHCLWLYAIV